MSSLQKPKSILPWWQWVLLVATCAFGVWLLIPADRELIENLIDDQAYTEARERLRQITENESAGKADHYHALELKIDRLTLPETPSREQLMDWWQRAAYAWHDTNHSQAIFRELLIFIPRLPNPQTGWKLLQPHTDEVPPEQYRKLSELFSDTALAANQPALAAQLYAEAYPSEERDATQSLELARRYRLAGDAQHALDALNNLDSPQATTLRISLLRELNRNDEAVALIRSQIREHGIHALTSSDIELLATSALAAGIPQEALDDYREYASDHPQDISIQRRLRALLIASGNIEAVLPITRHILKLTPNDPEEIRTLARFSEYAGQPNQAFDQWLKLVSLTQDIDAVDRLRALNPGLYRDTDLAESLSQIVPVDGRDDLTLDTAILMQRLGQYDEAKQYFTEYLSAVPSDFDAAQQLATLHYELFEFPQAEKWYRHASALKPDDLDMRMAIADTITMENRPMEAFQLYGDLLIENPTEAVVENYLRLAESLGRYDDLAQALRSQINRNDQPDESSYERLAYVFARLRENQLRENTLKEGLQHFPDNATMRIALAQLMADRKEYQGAQEVLSHLAELHTDLPAALLYLDLLRLNNDLDEESRYLKTPFAPTIRQNESLLDKTARAYEALHRYSDAESIRRRLLATKPDDHERVGNLARVLMLQNKERKADRLLQPFLSNPSPTILKLAAEISVAASDYLKAEQYQTAYLKSIPSPGETDWGALGDIRLSRGDSEGAVRAYTKANAIMVSRLRRPGEKTISKATLIQRADSLSLDERHYLLYLSARINDAQTAKGLAEHILQQNPSDRQTLLVLASMALENRNARETLRLARVYLSYYPDDYQGLYFLATGHYLAKEYSQANAVLRDLKLAQFQNRKFPFETDLASSALSAGDWYRAMLSYQTLLRHHDLNDELRSDVRLVLDGIYREHGRRIELTANSSALDRSQVWRYTAMHAAHISNRNWLEILYQQDNVSLDSAPGIQPYNRHRDQFSARLSRNISSRWNGDLWLGQFHQGQLGGVSLTYRFAQQREVTLEQTLNERATDSLALEALDGRESRSSLKIRWLIEADLTANLQIYDRAIEIRRLRVGRSQGIDFNIDQTIRRHGPHISAGYRTSIASFSPYRLTNALTDRARPIADPQGELPGREAIIQNLISPRLNRHGGGLLITDNIADAWKYRLTFGSDYDFELDSLGWNGAFALSFFPRKSIELSMETGYTSSASGSNAGNSAVLSNFLFRFHY